MVKKYKETKCLYLDTQQKQKLLEIHKEVTNAGGDVSLNQLIRDAIDLLVNSYQKAIVERYTPKSLEI
ncbi:MAG: hypothetical protein ACC609_11220 [Methanobacterium formicicum]